MKIRNIEIPHGLCLAPLAGVSDYAFRSLARAWGAEYTVSEMVSSKALCYEQLCKRPTATVKSKTAPLCAVKREELPMGVQIFGSEPKYMAEAAKLLVSGEYRGCCSEVPPSVIDINMGCPMAKIVGNGEGSALLKNPPLAAEILRAVANAVPIPVTAKIRAGWDGEHINAVEMAKRLEDAGASMICVHGRTKEQLYAPSADWEIIGRVKDAVSIPVVGNGDVFHGEDAVRMMRDTGCDGVMIARGARGNPWIFEEIKCLTEGRVYTPPTLSLRLETARQHAELIVAEKGESVGVPYARPHVAFYLSGVRGAAAARCRIMTATTLQDLVSVLDDLAKTAE